MVPNCMNKIILPLTLIFARHLSTKESTIYKNEQVLIFAKEYVKTMKMIDVEKHHDVWEVPEEYPLTQTFLLIIL